MIARLDFDKCIKQFAIAATGTILTFFIPWLLKRVRSFRNFGWLYGISGLVLLILVLFSGKVFGANLVLSLGPVSVSRVSLLRFYMCCLLHRCLISPLHLSRRYW